MNGAGLLIIACMGSIDRTRDENLSCVCVCAFHQYRLQITRNCLRVFVL